MNNHWEWSQVNTMLDWRPVNYISEKILIWWWLEEWRMWQIVEHPPNRDSLCKMDLTGTWTKHTNNRQITKNLAAQESIVYGQSLILNGCNSFKKEGKIEWKMKKSQSNNTTHKDVQCQKWMLNKTAHRLTMLIHKPTNQILL